MKKNGEFVGVDEKFIPENEKYIDESLLGDKEKSEAKVKKVYKTISFVHICIMGCFFLCLVASFIFIFYMMVSGDREQDISSSSFNSYLESYSGTEIGSSVGRLLDNVVTSNKTNNRIITVIYKETTTTSEDEIVNIKHSLDEWEKYEVSLDYDEHGYINKVTIKDI